MLRIKKTSMAIGTLATIAVPIAGVVACGTVGSEAGVKYVSYTGGAIANSDIAFVTDGGNLNDKTFNQSVFEGAKAATIPGLNAYTPQTSSEIGTQYNIATEKLLVLSGFNHLTPLSIFAEEHPEMGFVLVDATLEATDKDGNKKQQGNVASIIYKTEQAAFLEGVVAAKASSTGTKHKIGYYGGMDIPSVGAYIKGFKAGIEYFNDHNGNGQDVDVKDGGFVGNFTAGGQSRTIADSLVEESDFVMAVGGPQYKDVLDSIKDKTSSAKLIGVDVDIAAIETAQSSRIFASITKGLNIATKNVVTAIKANYHDATRGLGQIYTATLATDEVGITNAANDDEVILGTITYADIKAEAEKFTA